MTNVQVIIRLFIDDSETWMREVDPESFALVSGIDWSDDEAPLPNQAQAATNQPNAYAITKPATAAKIGPKSNNFKK